MADKKSISLDAQVTEILQKAQDRGASSSYFFLTTFQRYQRQLDTLKKLETAIDEFGPTVTKEYVKGRQNLVVNPAITEYNRTAQAANNTVATLVKIVESFKDESGRESLADVMARLMADE